MPADRDDFAHLDLGLRQVSGATISQCGLYRYSLWREWSVEGPVMGWVMLNPSTADAHTDDPTIRRCIGFAKREGCGGIIVRNLFAYRTPSPKALGEAYRAGVDVVGPENDEWLRAFVDPPFVGPVVAAWGAGAGVPLRVFERRVSEVVQVLGGVLSVLDGPTRTASPHPLYLAKDTPLVAMQSGSSRQAASGRIVEAPHADV